VIHPLIGYTGMIHLAAAVLGAIVYGAGLILTYQPMVSGEVEIARIN
jgi:hypothetical protein